MLQNHSFLAPPEQKNWAGTLIERMVLCFFALANLVILYQFLSQQLRGWSVFGYAAAAAYSAALVLVCVLILRVKVRPLFILLAVMALSLAVRACYAALIPTEPTSDFVVLYKAAKAAAAGDFSWSRAPEGYFFRWGYQIPFVLYESAVLWAFHSISALKLWNVFFMVGSNYLLYCIGKRFLSERAALCLTWIYAVFPGAVMYASVLTNQHISLFFLLLGVWLLLRFERWQVLPAAGLSLAVSDLMRPGTIVVIAAVFCCGLLRFLQRPSMEAFKRMAAAAALVLGSYWMTKSLTGAALIWADIAPNGIGNRFPEWMLAVGVGNIQGHGTYSEEYIDILFMDDPADRRALLAEIIGGFLRLSPGELLHFFAGKINWFWTSPQDLEWSLWNLDPYEQLLPGLTVQAFRTGMKYFERGALLLVYLLALPAPLLLWKPKKDNGAALFCIAVVCLIFCAYLLVEIQVRYRYFAMPFWLLAGGVGVERLYRQPISPFRKDE